MTLGVDHFCGRAVEQCGARVPCHVTMTGGGRRTRIVAVSTLTLYPVMYGSLPSRGEVEYVAQYTSHELARLVSPLDNVALEMSPHVLATFVPYRDLHAIARLHRIHLTKASRSICAVARAISAHTCDLSCCNLYAVFRMRASSQVVDPPFVQDTPVTFPPSPLTARDIADKIRNWTEALSAAKLAEGPCAICAQLTTLQLQTTARVGDLDLSHLDIAGITRAERFHAGQPVTEVTGPILHPGGVTVEGDNAVLHMCPPCATMTRQRKVGRHSLANGLWLGDVPAVLSSLNFIEQLLVARYRHNVCVVRVDKGQRKMSANAIVFPQPVATVARFLPPPREELDLCLAILFTGSARPTHNDYTRTPLLVRHRNVVAALQWLQLNHSDYGDVVLSYDNLASYPENEPPVAVLHRPTDGKLGGEMLAVYETSDDRGVETGPCPFAVHGLTGAEFAQMSYQAKVASAVKYFTSGGAALAVSHAAQPANTYDDIKLFPGMFPWLFPYGLGAMGNNRMQKQLPHAAHVKHLLLYADRRFATDPYFPFIVFNQQQIRGSSYGGYTMTEKSNIDTVVEKIMSIDSSALDSIIARGQDVNFVRPETDAERACFELIQMVDQVNHYVPGSATHRKYQRNEIKSMIMQLGVPFWFITFSPTDFKHPLCLYYCGMKIDLLSYDQSLPDYQKRMFAIAENPVACARFFDRIVNTFLVEILSYGKSDMGLFGPTESYYDS